MIPVRAKSFRWHWNRIKLATGCSSVSQSALSWAPTCAHPTDELAVSALFCCAFRVLTADPSHSISDASNIMKRDCVRPVVDRLQAEDGDDQKRCFERFFYCWCTNPAPMHIVTWDGGGAHANSRWNEELVRTERERERESALFKDSLARTE